MKKERKKKAKSPQFISVRDHETADIRAQREIMVRLTTVRKTDQAKHGLIKSAAIGFTPRNNRSHPISAAVLAKHATEPSHRAPAPSTRPYHARHNTKYKL